MISFMVQIENVARNHFIDFQSPRKMHEIQLSTLLYDNLLFFS